MKTLAHGRDKAEIVSRLRRLHPGSARQWGRMSVHQMVCHLSDAWRMAMGRKPVTPANTVFHRTVLKWFALYAPMRWPEGILTSPEIDQEGGGATRPAAFAADLLHLEELIEIATAPERAFTWERHPIFGRLSHSAWLRWGYLHMDHHLRQFGA